jgi:hypothetical protein
VINGAPLSFIHKALAIPFDITSTQLIA